VKECEGNEVYCNNFPIGNFYIEDWDYPSHTSPAFTQKGEKMDRPEGKLGELWDEMHKDKDELEKLLGDPLTDARLLWKIGKLKAVIKSTGEDEDE